MSTQPPIRITFLGTGTSSGVPVVGCKCPTCVSIDPRNTRFLPSVLLHHLDTTILLDCGPDFRHQALKYNITKLDAVVITHNHYDHYAGLDYIRQYNALQKKPMPLYIKEAHFAELKEHQCYHLFNPTPQKGGGVSLFEVNYVEPKPFTIGSIELTPVPVKHGKLDILGYRFGQTAYVTDCSDIPPSAESLLQNLDVLILGALRLRPHETHFNLAQAVQWVNRLKPKQCYFVHMCHDLEHQAINQMLKDPGSEFYTLIPTELAYDGLEIGK